MNIKEGVYKIIADVLKVDSRKISMDSNLSNDLGADSLDMLEVVTAIELQYKCEFPYTIYEGLTILSVGDLINHVEKLKPASAPQKGDDVHGGLYNIVKGKPVCKLTDKRCRQIPLEVLKNKMPGQNLCVMANCCLANNFYKLSQKVR